MIIVLNIYNYSEDNCFNIFSKKVKQNLMRKIVTFKTPFLINQGMNMVSCLFF